MLNIKWTKKNGINHNLYKPNHSLWQPPYIIALSNAPYYTNKNLEHLPIVWKKQKKKLVKQVGSTMPTSSGRKLSLLR